MLNLLKGITETEVNILKMAELTKYQKLKMYLPVNGYDSLKDLAEDWDVTVHGIRDFCRGKYTSPKLTRLTDDFIKEGDRKIQEHRNSKVTAN